MTSQSGFPESVVSRSLKWLHRDQESIVKKKKKLFFFPSKHIQDNSRSLWPQAEFPHLLN